MRDLANMSLVTVFETGLPSTLRAREGNNAVTFRGSRELREKMQMCYVLEGSSPNMKTIRSIVLILVATVLGFASATPVSAGQSEYPSSRDATGRIRMKHSPVLGINIPISVWIDGVLAGPFAKGHIFERHLTPGRHEVYASRPGPGRGSDAWYGTVDVRPGETLSFVVHCNPYRVILQPVGYVD